jgi:hypothetical protein
MAENTKNLRIRLRASLVQGENGRLATGKESAAGSSAPGTRILKEKGWKRYEFDGQLQNCT